MNKREKQTTLSLATIYSFRMLGLFMILPVFSLYAHQFTHATPFLIGVALGVYGLTQALLQIPFGMCSDYLGRKPVIVFGLILFAVGSIIAAISTSIEGIIAGRAIQGAGAIGSTLTALLADNVEDEHRLKAMSAIGMTIGLSFMIAMVVGPLLNNIVGLSGIFWLTAVLATIGLAILFFFVPRQKTSLVIHRDAETIPTQFFNTLINPELLRLNFGIFASHAILTALFIVIPIILVQRMNLTAEHQWMLYLPVLILSFFAMFPFIILAEAKRKMKPVFVGAIVILTISQFALWLFGTHLFAISLFLFLFFTAFTLLEASLPSLVAKIAPAGNKGTAMGIYSTSQFFGIFIGGSAGGFIFHHLGLNAIFLFSGCIGVIWIIIASTMKKPLHLSSLILPLNNTSTPDEAKVLQQQLKKITGIADVAVYWDEKTVYLKVDKQQIDEERVKSFL